MIEKVKCENCKFHRLDTLADGTKEDYCYPPLFCGLLSCPCKDRKQKHKKQCLWLNNKISYKKMLGVKYAYSPFDFKF